MRNLWLGMFSIGLLMNLSGCGVNAIGEECGEEGATESECEEGAICGKRDDSEAAECLKICTEQADCAADEECNGVSNSSVKGCRPKDDSSK